MVLKVDFIYLHDGRDRSLMASVFQNIIIVDPTPINIFLPGDVQSKLFLLYLLVNIG